MGAKYTNNSDVPLSVAVWLAHDTYDHNDDPFTISVTSLIKPIKQTILASRVEKEQFGLLDIESLVNSRMGTAFHDSVEKAWINGAKDAMRDLGYPESVYSRIVVNPEKLEKGQIPVYMEKRSTRKVGKWTISGKFDFVADGRLEDFKSTGVYTWIAGTKWDDYVLQGSMYRWLNTDIVTQDDMRIQFLFTDWSKLRYLQEKDKGYPDSRLKSKKLLLKSLEETEKYVTNRIIMIEKLWDAPEEQMPSCTDEELWVNPSVFKYYKDPTKTARSTKNFDNFRDANERLAQDGYVGVVMEVKGEVKACRYCNAFPVCKQKDQYIADGRLSLN